MEFQLSSLAKEYNYQVEAYSSLDSTNRVALAKAQEGKDRLWIVGEEQTSGRARRGRQWNSPKGNLYSSLLLSNNIDPTYAAQLGFVAGVSLADAISVIFKKNNIGSDVVRLKWPNDVLLKGSKASGILLELERQKDGTYALVIGIGVNVKHLYEDAPYPTQSIYNIGIDVSCATVFYWLSEYWALNYNIFLSSHGPEIIRKKWLEYAAHLGEMLTITGNNQIIDGVFSGLDENFNCVITDSHGEEIKVSAGDVHFGNVASLAAGRQ